MKIHRKNDLGPLGEVKSEQVQCLMGLEHVKVFEPGVLILCTGKTPVMDQITGRDSSHKSLWLSLPG